MKSERYSKFLAGLVTSLILFSLLISPALAAPGDTTRVSVDSYGVQAEGYSIYSSLSADGRYVAFNSIASNLVSEDTNGVEDVFVRDIQAGTTTRVSVASDGTQGNGYSTIPSISANGCDVAYYSDASNLVDGDTNGYGDIFVHDCTTGGTTRVSVASDGTQGDNFPGYLSISSDGLYVAFASYASNLVSGDTNGYWDIFVHDRQSGQTERVSLASGGSQGNNHSDSPSISANGRYVAFGSNASNLVAVDTNGYADIFIHDRTTDETTLISLASDGTQGNGLSWYPSISADGRCVAFYSDAGNLVPGDTNGIKDVFVRDIQTGTTTRVSVASDGTEGNWYSWNPSISADGRYVAFESEASNLVDGDTGGPWDRKV
jgi:Tol biopolymer transport system component